MAYYSRYRRRYPSRYRRRYSGYRRRYYRRRSSASSVSSRSRCRIVVKTQKVVTLTIPAGSRDSDVLSSSPYIDNPSADSISGCAGAVGSQLYQAYANLYDSVKCDGVISRISVISPVGGASGAVSTALTVVSAYDRMGTKDEVSAGPLTRVTLSDLLKYSTVQTRTAINNSVAKTARMCWASDIQERTTFHDCSFSTSSTNSRDKDWYANSDKVGYFAPAFWCAVQLAAAASTNPVTVNLLLEQVYYMTFRSPKFGVSQSTSSSSAAVRAAVAADDALAAESLDEDEVPQGLIDMTARAADDTGRMVRSHPTSGLTPDKKRQRTAMADLAERFERESDEWHKRYEDLDAQVAKRVGSKDWSRYPRSDRDLLQKLYNESSNKARAAEKLQRDIRDLDHEYPEVPAATAAAADLDHTDTLPLDT